MIRSNNHSIEFIDAGKGLARMIVKRDAPPGHLPVKVVDLPISREELLVALGSAGVR